MLVSLLFKDPILFIVLAAILLLSLAFHDFAHAFAAYKLGDYTAKELCRVTLNPLAHLDPLGTILLLFAGFGWGKPVPFNPYNLKHPKRDGAIIAFAGPFSNFLIATVAAILIHSVGNLLGVLTLVVIYNLILGLFNLIPVYPLDGYRVVYGFLPERFAVQWVQMQQYGTFILLVLVLTRSSLLIINPFLTLSLHLLGLSDLTTFFN